MKPDQHFIQKDDERQWQELEQLYLDAQLTHLDRETRTDRLIIWTLIIFLLGICLAFTFGVFK